MAREIVTVQTDGADKFKAEIWSQRVGLLSVLVMNWGGDLPPDERVGLCPVHGV
jgi:hypothetical protein